ncbi:MAG: hypothetical protein ACKO04_16215, partial [Actinomycetes bacterium]
MTHDPVPLEPPAAAAASWTSPSSGPPLAPDPSFVASVPLGGAAPVTETQEPRTDLRDLVLATVLFAGAL